MSSTAPPNANARSLADIVGLVGSTLCALHCIALPGLLVVGAALPGWLTGEGFHEAMLLLIVPAAAIAFGLGCRQHKDLRVLVLGSLGVAGLLLSGFVLHDLVGEAGERVGTLAAATLLITAHVRNLRRCREVC